MEKVFEFIRRLFQELAICELIMYKLNSFYIRFSLQFITGKTEIPETRRQSFTNDLQNSKTYIGIHLHTQNDIFHCVFICRVLIYIGIL